MNETQKDECRRLVEATLALEERLREILPVFKSHSQYHHALASLRHDREQALRRAKRASLHLGPRDDGTA